MSDTGINAVHVTGKPVPREPGLRGAGTFPAGDVPRAAAGQLRRPPWPASRQHRPWQLPSGTCTSPSAPCPAAVGIT